MKTRLLYLVSVALVAMLILVPSVFAQGTTAGGAVVQKTETTIEGPLVKTGGPGIGGTAVVLPAAAALLAGAGVLTYAVVRRRR